MNTAEALEPTDVTIKTAFCRQRCQQMSFNGMPKLQWRFWKTLESTAALASLISKVEQHEIVVRDARRHELSYEQTGFTLRPLCSKVVDWKAVALSGTEQCKLYEAEMEAVVRELHPEVKQIVWAPFLLRGGAGENPPAKGSMHLDYYTDDGIREAYLQAKGHEHPKADGVDEEKLELGMVLGVWKPRNACNPVHDYPLIVCDASTMELGDVVPQYQQFEHIKEGKRQTEVNVAGMIKWSDRQRWYYFHEQTADEVIVFHHRTVARPSFVNAHGAAGPLPLPEGAETRSSVEGRAFLFFEKGLGYGQAA